MASSILLYVAFSLLPCCNGSDTAIAPATRQKWIDKIVFTSVCLSINQADFEALYARSDAYWQIGCFEHASADWEAGNKAAIFSSRPHRLSPRVYKLHWQASAKQATSPSIAESERGRYLLDAEFYREKYREAAAIAVASGSRDESYLEVVGTTSPESMSSLLKQLHNNVLDAERKRDRFLLKSKSPELTQAEKWSVEGTTGIVILVLFIMGIICRR